jgi:alanine racemase
MPMVKADAYGVGVERALAVFETMEPWGYGVATVAEGRAVRAAGIERPVLVCSPTPPGSFRAAVAAGLTLGISDLEGLSRLEALAAEAGERIPLQIEVDTGMGRAGFDWRDGGWVAEVVRAASGPLRCTGVFTHLHSADEADPSTIREQLERLEDVLAALGPGLPAPFVHVANSAGALRCGTELPPLVRAGIFLYGGRAGVGLPDPTPVVSVRARVVFIKEAPPGATVGYGATHRASDRERWATLAIGYGDGLPRALSNRGHALIGGERVPIIGRVSMDVTVVNISSLHGVEVGDVATLIGSQGAQEITVDEVADRAGTISYEILTGLSGRLPRVWIDEGEG